MINEASNTKYQDYQKVMNVRDKICLKTSNVLSSKKAIYITMFIPGKSTFRSINIKYNINI